MLINNNNHLIINQATFGLGKRFFGRVPPHPSYPLPHFCPTVPRAIAPLKIPRGSFPDLTPCTLFPILILLRVRFASPLGGRVLRALGTVAGAVFVARGLEAAYG